MSGSTRSEAATAGLSSCGSDPIIHSEMSEPARNTDELQIEPDARDNGVDSWRTEVAARLERYRTRRKPRAPRYPSLLLPFDTPESWSRAALAPEKSVTGGAVMLRQEVHLRHSEPDGSLLPEQQVEPSPAEHEIEPNSFQVAESSAKVIEFPRSAAIPVPHASELAEPVFDFGRPRIVEAPEVLPPPPALGGMLIEPIQHEMTERRTESVLATPCASVGRRVAAVTIDGLIVCAALAAFAAVVFRITAVRGPILLLGSADAMVAVLLWAAYEFLFIVYTGSTPGLRVARLRLVTFEGLPPSRRARRWRVLTSFLSAFSAGMGYLWCFLNPEGLCWHDRITRTCVVSVPGQTK